MQIKTTEKGELSTESGRVKANGSAPAPLRLSFPTSHQRKHLRRNARGLTSTSQISRHFTFGEL